MNNPDVLHAIGVGAGPSFAFTFETADGAQKRVEIAAATEAGARVTLGDGPPLWQRNETQGFWSEWLADGSVYVNWRSYDGLADHGAALLQSLDAKHPRRLIIDLRDNDGGDYNVGRTFIEEIKSRPWLNQRGVLYVMIGRKTFSAAMTNAVDFKNTTEAILVGEPAGAAPNNWQEVRRFHLPNSGLRVGVSTRYYEFLPGMSEVLPDLQVRPSPATGAARKMRACVLSWRNRFLDLATPTSQRETYRWSLKMRKIRIIEHISLDGVIQAPGGRNEDGDYAPGGWTVPYVDKADVGEAIAAAQGRSFDLLLGRRTYDIFAGYWPKAENESDSGRSERRDEVRRDPQAGKSWMGSGRGLRCGHHGECSQHQVKGRP